ncbi:MAG: peptidoglycan recognition family protein [Clostridiales bacterium]|nr:peptidoglycan recognition family protein [Clostridiales bacterium]
MAWITRFAAAAICILLIVIVFSGIRYLLKLQKTENNHDYPEYVQEEYLTVNPYSRPGVEVKEINSIVIHYTANPGSTAKQNRDYFEGLANSGETKASSNFIIGLDGEVIACVPAGEVAYASNNRNLDTISIECCHEDETGEFTQETYDSLVKFSAWLCKEYNLKAKDLIRHYDVTGKICPKYFVENEEAWTQFKKDVAKMIKKI